MEKVRRLDKANFGFFQDFVWPLGLEEFNDYNLIFGWNASGKTTFSRIFDACIKKRVEDSDSFVLKTENSTINSNDLDSHEFMIKVFNADYIEQNVFASKKELAPIFYVGQDNIKNKKKLDGLHKEGNENEKNIDEVRNELEEASTAQVKLCTQVAKRVKDTLRSHEQDNSIYNNYN